MKDVRDPSVRSVHEEREDYFAGRITAAEYLNRALPALDDDRCLTDQFRRILLRLTGKNA